MIRHLLDGYNRLAVAAKDMGFAGCIYERRIRAEVGLSNGNVNEVGGVRRVFFRQPDALKCELIANP